MVVYAVIHHSVLIGLYTCAVDAHLASKALAGSSVTTCHLNAETEAGRALLGQ